MKLLRRYLLLLTCCLPLSAHATFSALGVLGDSLSDQGNLFDATGSITLGLFPVPPAPYFNGRFSNGPNWVDYYSAMNPGVPIGNAAYGGALSQSYGNVDNVGDPDLLAQPLVGQALADAAIGLDTELTFVPDLTGGNVAFALWIGANDLNSATTLGFTDAQAIVPTVLSNIDAAIDLLISRGVVSVYVANLPDLGKTPSGMSSAARSADLSAATLAFNSGLAAIAGAKGSQVALVDMWTPFNQILADPLAFGFTDVTTPCVDGIFDTTACASPDQHLFWDTVHPSTNAHALIAGAWDNAFNGVQPIPVPAALFLFGPALGLLFGVARRR